jgi:hypothetical protein
VKSAAGARISITDSEGTQVYRGHVPASGSISLPLIQYVQQRDGQVVHTPHTVTVQKDGKTKRTVVAMDKARRIEMQM